MAAETFMEALQGMRKVITCLALELPKSVHNDVLKHWSVLEHHIAGSIETQQKVNNNDIWIMILSTIRYSMGRRSYMVGLAPELVYKYEKFLDNAQLTQIAREINEELTRCERLGRTLGSASDHEAWKQAANAIRDIVHSRSKEEEE